MTKQELQQRLDAFFEDISDTLPTMKVTCSVGAYKFNFPQDVKYLMEKTDEVLYKAKENGRACYVIEGFG